MCVREVREESSRVMGVYKGGQMSLAMSWVCVREVMEESSHVMGVYKEAAEVYILIIYYINTPGNVSVQRGPGKPFCVLQ